MLLLLTACFPELSPDAVTDLPWRDYDGDGFSADEGDCDDTDPESWPGAVELGDGVDNDCDGEVDEGLVDTGCLLTWYLDQDGDGVGGDTEVLACDQPPDAVAQGGDCDDGNEERSPGLDEVCGNALDEDCDGEAPSCVWEGSHPLAEARSAVAEGTNMELFGLDVTAGDFVGDHHADLLVGAPQHGIGGAVYVFEGPVTGTLDTSTPTIVASTTGGNFGIELLLMDADGEPGLELVVGAHSVNGTNGWVYILTDATDTTGDPYGIIEGGSNTSTGFSLAVGDFGDGEQLAVGAPRSNNWSGSLALYSAPLSNRPSPDLVMGGVGTDSRTAQHLRAGDLAGDGTDRLVVTAPGRDRVYVVSPADAAVDVADGVVLAGPSGSGAGGVVEVCDLNGDGVSDLVTGPLAYDVGAVRVIYGPVTSNRSLSDELTLTGVVRFGVSVACPDLDGDGADDLAVSDDHVNDYAGEVYLWYGPLSGNQAHDQSDATFKGSRQTGYWIEGVGDVSGGAEEDLLITELTGGDLTGGGQGTISLIAGTGL